MVGQFNFRKFEPTDELVYYSREILSEVMDLVPVDSALMATVTKLGADFLCRLEIFSSSGEFVAEYLANDPKIAMEKVDVQIVEQITGWRTESFLKHLSNFWMFDRNKGQNPVLCWPGREI